MTHEDALFRDRAEKAESPPKLPGEKGAHAPEWNSPESSALGGACLLSAAFAGGGEDSAQPERPDAESPVPPCGQGHTGREGICCAPASAALGPRSLGIRLRKAGQVFFFPDEEHTVRVGSKVIVELEHGPALGEVASIVHNVAPVVISEDGTQIIGKVTGLATAQDIALHTENSILCAEASAFCKSCIRQRTLDMKLVDVEVLHNRSKIIFYFTAPARIDFRELVKDLVRNYRTRIELRQIGVRHETQMIGGIGNCGMVCCCHKYLRRFAPVTIKMAKEQNLFLNPAKLSGMCGRLLCCLSFEQGNYEEFNRRCPKLGKKYVTDLGTVKILRANMFSQSIVALTEAGEESELSLEEWDRLTPRRADPPGPEQQRTAASHNAEDPALAHKGARQAGRSRSEAADALYADMERGAAQQDAQRLQRPRKRRKISE